jgi:hypothetical protein
MSREDLARQIMEATQQSTQVDPQATQVDPQANLAQKILDQSDLDQTEENDENIFDTISNIFTGTKSTEFAAMPEIGSYQGPGSGKVALGLLLTPNQQSQAEIITKALPGSAVREDKYGNPIINMPDGKSFYLNKPGVSFQDVLQTTAQILQYIPGYNYVAKKAAKSYLKRTLGQAAVSGGTSVVQDVGAGLLGAEQFFDPSKTAVAVIAPLAFEGVVVPVGRTALTILKRIGKNKKYVNVRQDGTIGLTQQGKEVLEESGVDPNSVSEQFVDRFFRNYTKGLKNDIDKVKTEAEFGIDLASNQTGLAKDKISLADLYEAAKGAFGTTAQKQSIEFLEKQNIQIKEGFKSLINRFNKGQIDVADLEGAGSQILDTVRKNYAKAEDNIQTLYNVVNKQAVFTGGGSNIQLLPNSARKAVIDSVGSIEPAIMPNTVAALKSLDDLAANVNKSNMKKADPVIFDNFIKKRQFLNDLIDKAKREGGPDYRAIVSIKKSYDKFLDDSIDNTLFAGGDTVKALKNANQAYAESERKFGVNPIIKNGIIIKDKAGEVLHKIINDIDVGSYEVINYAIGAKKLGAGQVPLRVIRRLKKIIGVTDIEKSLDNADFVALRTAALERVFGNSFKNDKFLPSTLVKEFDEIFKNNKDFMKELFTTSEVGTLRRFVDTVRKTLAPADIMNFSNTSSLLQRMIQQASRGFLGGAAIKFGFGINGLLAVRNAFDRAGEVILQRKGRDRVLQQIGDETSNVLSKVRKMITEKTDPFIKTRIPISPRTRLDVRVEKSPTITGSVQQQKGQKKDVPAEQIQPYEMRDQSQSAVPTLDRNMFASLFPGDTLGAAIQERKR